MAAKQVKKQLPKGMEEHKWKPGQSGNPNGRPKKGMAITDLLKELLDTTVGERTKRELIMDNVIEMALNKDRWAIEYLTDRTEGKALERIEQKIEMDEVVIK
jgi:hypothetical protein